MKVYEYIVTSKGEEKILIRCKDCKYAIKQYRTNLPWLVQWEYSCRYYNTHSVMGDDWCSRAERKEE